MIKYNLPEKGKGGIQLPPYVPNGQAPKYNPNVNNGSYKPTDSPGDFQQGQARQQPGDRTQSQSNGNSQQGNTQNGDSKFDWSQYKNQQGDQGNDQGQKQNNEPPPLQKREIQNQKTPFTINTNYFTKFGNGKELNQMTGDEWCKSQEFGPQQADCIGVIGKQGDNYIGSWAWVGDKNEKQLECKDKIPQQPGYSFMVYCQIYQSEQTKKWLEERDEFFSIDSCITLDPSKINTAAQLNCHPMCINGYIQTIIYAVKGFQTGECPNYEYNYLCHQDFSVRLQNQCKMQSQCMVIIKDQLWNEDGQFLYKTDRDLSKCDEPDLEKQQSINILINCQCSKSGYILPSKQEQAPQCE